MIGLGIYLAKNHKKDTIEANNTVNDKTSDVDDVEKENDDNAKEDNELDNETEKNNEQNTNSNGNSSTNSNSTNNVIHKEENPTEDEIKENETMNNTQNKAIEAVKKQWTGNKDANFAIDNSATLPGNQIMVKVTEDAVSLGWYIVNTQTWEVTEY